MQALLVLGTAASVLLASDFFMVHLWNKLSKLKWVLGTAARLQIVDEVTEGRNVSRFHYTDFVWNSTSLEARKNT